MVSLPVKAGQFELPAKLRLNPLRAMAAEGVNGSRPGDRLTPMPGPLWNEILFSGIHRHALVAENECVAALTTNMYSS